MQINKLRADHTIDFAAEELKKYLRMMTPERGEIAISYDPEAKDGFRLGLLEDFPLPNEAPDPELDDVVHIDTQADGGILAGSNPRSVLYAVYRFLRLNGCRWLFPGVDGEFIPHKPISPQQYHHMADTRYRGHTTEGDPSLQHVLSYIDFCAKQELNQYGIIGIYDYHIRYYRHRCNADTRPPEPITPELCGQWKGMLEAEVRKRGMLLIDGPHEFMVMALGFGSGDRYKFKSGKTPFPEDLRKYLAEVNGKREIRNGDLLHTNACMSNPEWRARYVKTVSDYIVQHPQVETVMAILGDGHHNHCECPDCQKLRPSDFHVMLLNAIDEELTRRGSKTKLQFNIYVDQMFPPKQERLRPSDRFMLSFPPICRSYASGVDAGTVIPPAKPYLRNKWEAPHSFAECVSYLRAWQEQFHGQCQMFEYHFWLAQFRDPGLLNISRRIYEDMRDLPVLGMNGILEDGSNRHYFPHGFHCHIYAETLVNRDLDYDAEQEDYFSHLYGEDWKAVRQYLRGVSDAFEPHYMEREAGVDPTRSAHYNPAMAERFASVKELAAQARELAAKHMEMPTRPQTVAYRLLRHHADYCEGLADFFAEKALGHDKYALELCLRFWSDFGKREWELEPYMDFGLAANAIRRLIRKTEPAAIEF